MLIVLTQDKGIISWCDKPDSGASQWGHLNVIQAGGGPAATVILERLLGQVGSNEALCITGHGSDTEVGDENPSGKMSWVWSASELAAYLAALLPNNYSGPILMEVCSKSVTSFAANVAEALRAKGKLKGVWIFGYSKSVDVTHKFPDPAKLSQNLELSGHQC
jgi:hypothetical protein